MINGNAVSADQVEALQAQCELLRGAALDASATTRTPAADAETCRTASSGASGQIDLNTWTVEMCEGSAAQASHGRKPHRLSPRSI